MKKRWIRWLALLGGCLPIGGLYPPKGATAKNLRIELLTPPGAAGLCH